MLPRFRGEMWTPWGAPVHGSAQLPRETQGCWGSCQQARRHLHPLLPWARRHGANFWPESDWPELATIPLAAREQRAVRECSCFCPVEHWGSDSGVDWAGMNMLSAWRQIPWKQTFGWQVPVQRCSVNSSVCVPEKQRWQQQVWMLYYRPNSPPNFLKNFYTISITR